MHFAAKVQKIWENTIKSKFIVKIFVYLMKMQYFCTTFLKDIHNKDYSDV